MWTLIIPFLCGAGGGVLLLGLLALLSRRRKPPPAEARKKIDTSKLLALWAVVIATLSVIASITLSAFDKQPLTDMTNTVFMACIGYLITYASKSAFEKHSRNMYGVDANGIPFAGDGGNDAL